MFRITGDPDVGRCEWINGAKYYDAAETNFLLLKDKTVHECVYRCQMKEDCHAVTFKNSECKVYTNPDEANVKYNDANAELFYQYCSGMFLCLNIKCIRLQP